MYWNGWMEKSCAFGAEVILPHSRVLRLGRECHPWREAQDTGGCLHARLCQRSSGSLPPAPATARRSLVPRAGSPEPAFWSEVVDSVLRGKAVHHCQQQSPRATLHLSKTKQTKYTITFLTAAKHHLERIGNYCFV